MKESENYKYLKTLTLGFGVASIGILLAILGLIFLNSH